MELLMWMYEPEAWIALVTLTVLEIVLGIDNIVFISIFVEPLPPDLRAKARLFGLALAMLTRIALLFTLTWIMRLTAPWFSILGEDISGRDLILIGGGLFLLAKSTLEIHSALEGGEHESRIRHTGKLFMIIIMQIAVIDIIFSLDSVITAIGMAKHIEVMVLAIIIAVIIMMISSGTVSEIVYKHPTIKMLALSFLVLIGVALIADGFDQEIPKGYIYFAMAFSVAVEFLNIRVRGKAVQPVRLYSPVSDDEDIIRRKEKIIK